jgi:hypothetical protein
VENNDQCSFRSIRGRRNIERIAKSSLGLNFLGGYLTNRWWTAILSFRHIAQVVVVAGIVFSGPFLSLSVRHQSVT